MDTFTKTDFPYSGLSIVGANNALSRSIPLIYTSQSQSNEFQIPPGTILAFAGAVIPKGWLKADGSTVSVNQYSALFQVIGDFYGSGDQINTFNLPDLRSRVVVGTGKGAGLTNRVLGNQFGSEQHVLTQSEMPAHTHPLKDPGHNHDMGSPTRGQVWGVRPDNVHYCYGTDNGGVTNNPPTLQAKTGISVELVGDGTPHDIIQPSIALSYIIKY